MVLFAFATLLCSFVQCMYWLNKNLYDCIWCSSTIRSFYLDNVFVFLYLNGVDDLVLVLYYLVLCGHDVSLFPGCSLSCYSLVEFLILFGLWRLKHMHFPHISFNG
jgi:hypothetical protein